MSAREPGPDFLIVGAAKCGTTTLWSRLDRHEDTFLTRPKEPGYFDGSRKMDRAAYRRLFENAPAGALRGEASTSYAKAPTMPGVVARIRAEAPDVRIIYMIREPFARMRSHFEMRARLGRANGTLQRALEVEREYLDVSLYAYQITPYIETFGRERVHILRLEDLAEHPPATMEAVFRFLDLDPARVRPVDPTRRLNARPDAGPTRMVGIPSPLRAMGRLLPQELRSRLRERLQVRSKPSDLAIGDATRARYAQAFRDDYARLRAIVGPDMDLYGYA